MNTHIDKIGALRKMLHERDAIAQMLAILEEIGNVDEALRQAKARIDTVRDEEQAARDDLQKARAELEEVRAGAERIVTEANARAELIITAAEASAGEIRALANAARDEAHAAVVEARAAVTAATETRDKLLEEIRGRSSQLDAINDRIEQAKAAARQAFGGAPDVS